VVALTLLGGYCLVNLQPARAWMYFASALPAAAVLSAALVLRVPSRRLSAALVAVCLVAGAITFSASNWGIAPWMRPLATALGAPIGSSTCLEPKSMAFCPNPPRREDWHGRDILETIHTRRDCRRHPCRLLVLQYNYHFSRVVLSFFRKDGWPDSRLVISQVSPAYPRAHLARDVQTTDYLVYEDAPNDPLDGRIGSLLSPPEFTRSHREVAAYPLPNGRTARLIERVGNPR
jgi:hypothetical protein